MDAKEFIREWMRMCEKYGELCEGCPMFRKRANPCELPELFSEVMVDVVQKWSKENPVVTNGKKILELIAGEASQWESGGTSKGMVQIRVSKKWWDAEYKEER